MAETPVTPPTDSPSPPSEEDNKKKLHGWLDEWADAREARRPPKRTSPDKSPAADIFSSLFGG